MELTVKTGKRERDIKLERAQVDIPVVESSMERRGSRKVGHVSLAGFTSGAHGEVGQAVRKLLRQGAPEGVGTTDTLEGVHSQTAYVRLPGSGWVVATVVVSSSPPQPAISAAHATPRIRRLTRRPPRTGSRGSPSPGRRRRSRPAGCRG